MRVMRQTAAEATSRQSSAVSPEFAVQDLRYTIKQRIAQNYRIKTVEVTTDAEIALYGVNLGKAGLVLIAGTGSVCLGKNDEGEKATAGGWGPLAGDEGGGAGIARRALQSIAKASDGRGIKTVLSDYAVEYFRALSADDLTVAIYSPQMDNARIAGFALFVIKAAQKDNDKIAKEILNEAGFELGIAANAVIKKLNLNRKKFPVGYVGSIFNAGKFITDSVMQTIHQTAPKAFLTEPELCPANAAAVMAVKLFENTLTENKTASFSRRRFLFFHLFSIYCFLLSRSTCKLFVTLKTPET